jgi:hypothetical protein
MSSYVFYYLNGDITKEEHKHSMLSYSNQVLLGLQMGDSLGRTQQGFIVTLAIYHRSELWVHPWVTESKHHAYTMNTTLTQERQGLKYSTRVINLMNNINTTLTWIRSWLLEKSQKQAQVEHTSASVQDVEREHRQASTSSKLFHSLSHYF